MSHYELLWTWQGGFCLLGFLSQTEQNVLSSSSVKWQYNTRKKKIIKSDVLIFSLTGKLGIKMKAKLCANKKVPPPYKNNVHYQNKNLIYVPYTVLYKELKLQPKTVNGIQDSCIKESIIGLGTVAHKSREITII